ncbi:hypothetical protein Hanom_Chr04g00354511 [Helianthus anomalus]
MTENGALINAIASSTITVTQKQQGHIQLKINLHNNIQKFQNNYQYHIHYFKQIIQSHNKNMYHDFAKVGFFKKKKT